MDIREIIRAAIPKASNTECEWIIWERTAFPFKNLTAKDFYKAASRVKRAAENKIALCDLCDNKADSGKSHCVKCLKLLSSEVI